MYVKKLPYIIYRQFPKYGYLTDNRNFGYDTSSKSCLKVGDLLLSMEGGLFYSILENHFLHISQIVDKLIRIYSDVPSDILFSDASEFYKDLANKGFVVCVGDLDDKVYQHRYFSYDNLTPHTLSINQDPSIQYEKVFLEDYVLTRVHVDVSSRCNENCVHCYIPNQYKCGFMKEDVFEKVLDECVQMKVLNITLSGGEPMLNPFFKSFLQKCYAANFSINILSNLTALTDELLEVISSNPLVSIQTSLYAMDENVHDSITRNKGSFSKTISAIRRLHKCNVPMQINCPIMRQNLHDYRDVLEFAATLNVEASSDYALYRCYDASDVNLNCRIDNDDVMKILLANYHDKQLLQEAVEGTRSRRINDKTPICSVCKSSLCVSNDGDVYPCEGWQRMILGNLKEKSLAQIWNDEPKTRALRALKYKDFRECSTCEDKMYCTTCLIMNANENIENNCMKVNPYMCNLARLKRMAIESCQHDY